MDLSIIIPMFNHERYVKEALYSMIEKEFDNNIEILVVNDASTDKSIEVVKQISKEYKNIKIIENKKNIGCAESINKALKLATGKYIGINSSDDYVDSGYYSKMLKVAIEYDADVVCANIATVDDNGENVVYNDVYDNNLYSNIIENKLKMEEKPHLTQAKYLLGHWTASSSSTKIIKKELYDKYTFVGSKANDIPSIYPILASSKKTIYYPKLYKYYRNTPKSLSKSIGIENYNSVIDSFMVAFDRLEKIPNSTEIQQTLLYNNFLTYFWSVILNIEDGAVRIKCLNYFINKTDALTKISSKILKNNELFEYFVLRNKITLKKPENYFEFINNLIKEKEREQLHIKTETMQKEKIALEEKVKLIQKEKPNLKKYNGEILLELMKNNKKIDDLNCYINNILNSKSMKITKPLRIVMHFLKHGGKK